MLLTHGARSVLRAATVAQRAGRSLDALRQWALGVQVRSNHNKATPDAGYTTAGVSLEATKPDHVSDLREESIYEGLGSALAARTLDAAHRGHKRVAREVVPGHQAQSTEESEAPRFHAFFAREEEQAGAVADGQTANERSGPVSQD